MQLDIAAGVIETYSSRQPTISEHQEQIREYLGLRRFGEDAIPEIEKYVFDEPCRLEQPSALLAGIDRYLREYRQFSPYLLKHIRLLFDDKNSASLEKAVRLLREMNDDNKRKLPENAPVGFIPKKIRPLIKSNGKIEKSAWECALLTAIRDEIKSGNISVGMSKRFARPDSFFIL
jgi:hypothetical protein